MTWTKWMRLIHRWVSIVFTLGVTINFVAVVLKKYTNALGLLALLPLAVLLLTGLYLFALPYFPKSGVRACSTNWGTD